jgi:hypothetical protein
MYVRLVMWSRLNPILRFLLHLRLSVPVFLPRGGGF